MIPLAIIANAILGGIWRRWLGGWDGPSLWAIGTPFERLLWDGNGEPRRSFIMAAGVVLTWPLWLALPWWGAILATGACLVFWSEGHRFDKWTIILRYPLVGAIYPIAKRIWPARWTEIAEVVIGAAFWGLIALAP